MDTSNDWNDTVNPLIGALQRGHYLLYSQSIAPLAAVDARRPYQEILIRFLEEERRLLPPGMFFPILQEQGLMPLLDCWVISQVLKLQSLGSRGGLDGVAPRTSINLSEDSVADPEFTDFVIAQIEKWKPEPDTLSFEILESVARGHLEELQEVIAELAPLGCGFGIGSFRGGMEEFALLDQLQVNFVKIDGGLVRKILVSPSDFARVEVINQRCHEKGLSTIAELVEDRDTSDALGRIGVDYAQGFGISEPVPFLAG